MLVSDRSEYKGWKKSSCVDLRLPDHTISRNVDKESVGTDLLSVDSGSLFAHSSRALLYATGQQRPEPGHQSSDSNDRSQAIYIGVRIGAQRRGMCPDLGRQHQTKGLRLWRHRRSLTDISQVSEDQLVLNKVKQIRAAGGDVSVSFGGYNGNSLGHACPDANSLANAYQAVIDKYDLTNVDFDVENTNLGDVTGENKRFQAIKILKERARAKGRELFVTLTLPSTTVGLSDLGREEIKRGVADGAQIDLYKVM